MGFWEKLRGARVPKSFASSPPVSNMQYVEAVMREAGFAARSKSAMHRDRFARAIVQCEVAVTNGEATEGQLSELRRWHEYYDGMARLEAGAPDAAAAQVDEGDD